MTQAELLKRSKLSFVDACEVAKSTELACKEIKVMQPSRETEVNAVKRYFSGEKFQRPIGKQWQIRGQDWNTVQKTVSDADRTTPPVLAHSEVPVPCLSPTGSSS